MGESPDCAVGKIRIMWNNMEGNSQGKTTEERQKKRKL